MKKSIVFFGTPEFAVPALTAVASMSDIHVQAVVTQPDRISGRGKKKRKPPVKIAAEELGIPIFQPENVKLEKEFFNSLDDLDGAVVVAFGQIFPQWLIDHFQHKCVNIHSSLLPRWRGAAPMQRAIMAGDKKTGVCLMQIVRAMDAGPVYACAEKTIGQNETCGELHDNLAALGAALLKEHLFAILDEKLEGIPQKSEGVTHAEKIQKAEGRIDWTKDAATIHNTIRALSPFPGAFSFYGKKRIKILKTQVGPDSESHRCGEIFVDKEACYVRCMGGSIKLEKVQLEGKKASNISDFLRGHTEFPGSILT